MSSLSAPAGGSAAVPSCVEIEGECAKSGWIYKQSKHVKKWNKRYFVLWPKVANPKKGRLLFYYTTPQVRAQWLRATLALGRLALLTLRGCPRRIRSRVAWSRWCRKTTARRWIG